MDTMIEKPRYVMNYLNESVVDTMLEELRKRDAGTPFDDLIYEIHPVDLDATLFVLWANERVYCVPIKFAGNAETRGVCVVADTIEDERDPYTVECGEPVETFLFSDRSLEKIRETMKERSVSKTGTAE